MTDEGLRAIRFSLKDAAILTGILSVPPSVVLFIGLTTGVWPWNAGNMPIP